MYKIHMKFVVFGSSGAGKSTLMEILHKINPNITIHKKDSTRPPRKNESKYGSLDLRHVDNFDKELYDVVYHKYGHYYGVRRDTILNAFQNKEIHFIILRDIHAIQQFKYVYLDTKAIFIHSNPEDIPKRLQSREGMDFEERKKRIHEEFNEFVEHNTLFDHVVINFWDLKDSQKQLQNIINSYIRKSTLNIS